MKEYKITINGTQYAVAVAETDETTATVSVNGTEYCVEHEGIKARKKIVSKVTPNAAPALAEASAAVRAAAPKASAGGTDIKSPLPGTVLDVMVHEGDTVKAGQRLILLEAMKMENNIDTDRDGVIKAIKVRKGDAVLEGDILVTIG